MRKPPDMNEKNPMPQGDGPVKARYQRMTEKREPFLRRAREVARLTIPSLMPEEGHNSTSDFKTPWQSIGATGLRTLASKLLLSLFPPNSPFFRHMLTAEAEMQVPDDAPRSDIEKNLRKLEKVILEHFETNAFRVPLFEALMHILGPGNVTVYIPKEGSPKVYHLDHYVCCRDASGRLLELITKEGVAFEALPPDVQKLIPESAYKTESGYKSLDVYTHVKREGNLYVQTQEVAGVMVPSARGQWKLENVPWLVLRGVRIDGEDYGRGYIEEFLGDLKTVEGLTQCIVEGGAQSARFLWGIKPNSVAKPAMLAKLRNGSFFLANPEDVWCLQAQKAGDLSVAMQAVQDISRRLASSFLMMSSVQRDAERVTAEEIHRMANELESTLGGMYSLQSQELQLPVVRIITSQLQRAKKLLKFPEGVIKPTIITGLEALGRGHDLTRLRTALGVAKETLGDGYISVLNVPEGMSRIFLASGVDTEGLLKSSDQLAQEQQQAMQMQTAQKLGPAAIGAAAKVAQAPEAAAQPQQ